MAEYKQPKSVPVEKSNGYPQTGIGMDDVWVKGKFPAGTKQKKYVTMRGAGAAVRGTKFMIGSDD